MPRTTSDKKKRMRGRASSPSGAEISKGLLGDFAIDDIQGHRLDRYTFTIYVGGEPTVISSAESDSNEPGVEHNMADRFELNLGILSGIDPNRPILINLSSDGGFWDKGMKMFSAILACPNPITVLATKDARSMTSIIPLAADRFLIRPPAQYMFHHGTYTFDGLTQEAESDFIELLKTREMMLRIYQTRLREQGKFRRWSFARIQEMLTRQMEKKVDVWLSADEAKLWGFADDVFVGDWSKVRAVKLNKERRQSMFETVRRPIDVKIIVT